MSQTKRYEGKAKILMPVSETELAQDVKAKFPEGAWLQTFKDDLTAFDGKKKDQRAGKGVKNQQISTMCFEFLAACGFQTHLIESLDERSQVIHHLEMLPVEAVVRRVATGSLVRRLGVEDGKRMHPPLFEFFLKNDDLGDPLMAPVHVPLVHPEIGQSLLKKVELLTLSMFGHLEKLFEACDLKLIDGKFEFGMQGQNVVLGDEISPDTLRIWTHEGKKLDKDVFRHDLGDVMSTYDEILHRLKAVDIQALSKKCIQEGVAAEPYEMVCEVTPLADVLDPEGQAALDVLSHSELKGIQEVRAGRHFSLTLNRVLNGYELARLEDTVKDLFANPLIQEWQLYINRV